MTFAGVLTGTAEGYALIERTVVADLRRLTNDDSGTVVDEEATSDGRTGMDLNAGDRPCCLADGACGEEVSFFIQSVRDLMCKHGMQTGVEQKHFHVRGCRRVTFTHDAYFIADLVDRGDELACCGDLILILADLCTCPAEGITDIVCE